MLWLAKSIKPVPLPMGTLLAGMHPPTTVVRVEKEILAAPASFVDLVTSFANCWALSEIAGSPPVAPLGVEVRPSAVQSPTVHTSAPNKDVSRRRLIAVAEGSPSPDFDFSGPSLPGSIVTFVRFATCPRTPALRVDERLD
jgi:hypothetical protein